jgi:hypothetical protein
VPLKELESWIKRGQNVPFLREICPRKKCTPNIGTNIGARTGILLTDIKVTHYPKYKVMNVSLKDPEKLASNMSILDNLTYSDQLMIEFNMEDPFRICFPDSAVSLASLTMDPLTTKPIFKDLIVDHR